MDICLLSFIFQILQEHLKTLLEIYKNVNLNISNSNSNEKIEYLSYFNIPYILRTFQACDLWFRHKLYNGINYDELFSLYIKILPNELRSNVVYKIPYKNYDALYVEQAGRLSKTRLADCFQTTTAVHFLF